MPDYIKPLHEILRGYNINTSVGRTAQQARAALEKYGKNKLDRKSRNNIFQKFLFRFKDVTMLMLIAAAVISLAVSIFRGTGEYLDSIIIIAIVVVNVVFGVCLELKREKSLGALKDMFELNSTVMRDGKVIETPAINVVPGDIILLDAGDFIPADGRIIESDGLLCDESVLTGESEPVEKDGKAVIESGAPIGARFNMVYSGCSVVCGHARAVVTATGANTEIGKLEEQTDNAASEITPMQEKLARFGKYLGFAALGIFCVIFIVGLIRQIEILTLLTVAAALAASAAPHGLMSAAAVVLALWVSKLAGRGAVVRKLSAVEALASVSVICSDKTGVLTQNRMTVRKVWSPGSGILNVDAELPEKTKHFIRLASMCNDVRIEGDRYIGDPAEIAIVEAAAVCGMDKNALNIEFPRVAELPFDPSRKLMTTVHEVGGKLISVTKGTYDVLLPLCVNSDNVKADEVNLRMSKSSLHVMAVACKEIAQLPADMADGSLENGLMFIGLIGMLDSPREESSDAIKQCGEAGIRTVMISDDNTATASAIARRLGIAVDDSQTLSGTELAEMPQWDLEDNITKYNVYARVNPEDKLRIVEAWQENDASVAITGGSVDDTTALKAADIGFAMGITGKDIAREAADIVLADDNYATIAAAVESGRGIYDNIKRTIQFLLCSNLGAVIAVLFAVLLGWGMPLLAVHLLLISMLINAFTMFAPGLEPVDKSVMRRKPIRRDAGIFANGLGLAIVLEGVVVGALILAGYGIGSFVELSAYFPHSREIGMTMAFLVLAFTQLTQAVNCRSRFSVFKIGVFTNKVMNIACLGSIAIVLLICLVPPVRDIFHITGLSVAHWLIAIALSIAPLLIVEPAKLILNQKKK